MTTTFDVIDRGDRLDVVGRAGQPAERPELAATAPTAPWEPYGPSVGLMLASSGRKVPGVSTRAFASKCRLYTVWPPGSICRLQLAEISVSALPHEVIDALRAEGCSDWLEPGESVPLGEAACLSLFGAGSFGPRPCIPLAEIVGLIKANPTPEQRRAMEREAAQARERIEAEKRAEQARRDAERGRAIAAEQEIKDEAERRRSPQYCLRKMEELASKVLGTK
jgi:hypothetical protein